MNVLKTNSPIDTVPYGISVSPDNRVGFLEEVCSQVLRNTPGYVLEVGVYKGGTLTKLAQTVKNICPEFCVIGIDTFTGHPYTDGHPCHPKGKYSDVDLRELNLYIEEMNLTSHVKLYKGMVENIFNLLHLPLFSFAHIDCDLYLGTKYCAQNVPRLINKGGMIYFDDYGHEHCPGATKAIEEVFPKNSFKEVYLPEDNTCWSCYVNL